MQTLKQKPFALLYLNSKANGEGETILGKIASTALFSNILIQENNMRTNNAYFSNIEKDKGITLFRINGRIKLLINDLRTIYALEAIRFVEDQDLTIYKRKKIIPIFKLKIYDQNKLLNPSINNGQNMTVLASAHVFGKNLSKMPRTAHGQTYHNLERGALSKNPVAAGPKNNGSGGKLIKAAYKKQVKRFYTKTETELCI